MFAKPLALLLPLVGWAASAAAEPGFRLAGHTGVATVSDAGDFRVSRGTDDLLFVWTAEGGLPRAWKRIEPDADILVQGDRVALFEEAQMSWLQLPDLKRTAQQTVAGSVRCRGGEFAWSWASTGEVTLHASSGSELLSVQASPGEDASCLLSPLGALLIWSDETGVKALLRRESGTSLLSASIANDGLVDAGASATAVWASVRSSGGETIARTTLLGSAPAAAPASGWRTCDTFDATGAPLPCRTLSQVDARAVTRPEVPAWTSARWSDDRVFLSGAGGAVPGPSEAEWAGAPPVTGGTVDRRETTVRGRKLVLNPNWMAGCAEEGWQVEDRSGTTPVVVAGPICAPAPHWVSLPDDRWAMLQVPSRASALIWADGARPTRLTLPDAPGLAVSMALRSADGWWIADADAAKSWRQGAGDGPAWSEAAVPLLADRTLTLARAGEVLTLTPNGADESPVHLLVTASGTAAWTDDGRWWADTSLLPHLVWVGADGVPYATDDPGVRDRFERKLLVRLWDRLADAR